MLTVGRQNSQAEDAIVLKGIWVFTMRTVALLLGFQAIASIVSISKGFRERKKSQRRQAKLPVHGQRAREIEPQ